MKKILVCLLFCLCLCACTVKPTEDKVAPDANSPFATIGEAVDKLGRDNVFYQRINDKAYIYCFVNEKHYQLTGDLGTEKQEQIDKLDVFANDYEDKVYEVFSDVVITDTLELDKYIESKEVLDSFIGKSVSDLETAGFNLNGWSVWDDVNIVFADKNDMDYNVSIVLPEGFDPEEEFTIDDLKPAIIEKIEFNQPSYMPVHEN